MANVVNIQIYAIRQMTLMWLVAMKEDTNTVPSLRKLDDGIIVESPSTQRIDWVTFSPRSKRNIKSDVLDV